MVKLKTHIYFLDGDVMKHTVSYAKFSPLSFIHSVAWRDVAFVIHSDGRRSWENLAVERVDADSDQQWEKPNVTVFAFPEIGLRFLSRP